MGKCFAVFPSLLSASTTRFNLACCEKQTYLDETSSFAYPKRGLTIEVQLAVTDGNPVL